MSKTNDLRTLVKQMISPVCASTYYEVASKDALYPHIVFSFPDINIGDLHRDDISLYLDIWDKSHNADVVEELADKVERVFDNQNMPQDTILPTFYVTNRTPVPDEDKQIRHRLIIVEIQNYERQG